ncbi:MAG: hypothetical protein GY925_14725 [Actinomycetia bacterium]|nr:hypothetical protein [bacterium]MCP4960508.1 hypothetical protein [Actinomycetes bacterium]
MTPLFVWLGAVGIADLAGAGVPTAGRMRYTTRFTVAGVAAAVLVLISGYEKPWITAIAAGCIGSAMAAVWASMTDVAADQDCPNQQRASAAALWGFMAMCGLVVGTSTIWPDRSDLWLADWLDDLPYATASVSTQRTLAIAATVVFLTETGNHLVRLALGSVRVTTGAPTSPDSEIKGGRLIGPIERILIFGLAIGGEPTAAALIVSAKGLLRYPEIGSRSKDLAKGQPSPAVLSEYLVVGSMVSWSVALSVLVWVPS